MFSKVAIIFFCLELLILWALVDLILQPVCGLQIPQSGELLGSKVLQNQGHVFFCPISVCVCVCVYVCVCVCECARALMLVNQFYLTLWDPLDCRTPGSSVHATFQARILEWVAFPAPGDLPDLGISTNPCLLFTTAPPRKPLFPHPPCVWSRCLRSV